MEMKTIFFLVAASFLQIFPGYANGLKNLIYAVNAGGGNHVDSYGVHYQKDPLNEGVESDYGMRLDGIGRVDHNDEVLYRTERYSHDTFGYDIPTKGDGKYVLVLKFCEVYFGHSGAKIFDVVLNKNHMIVPELDIYSRVGLGVAHDEIIPFEVSQNGKKLVVFGSESVIKNGKIPLQFVKGSQDNPKINAFYVVKGTVDDVPRLPEMSQYQDSNQVLFDEDDNEDIVTGGFDSDNRVYSAINGKYRRQPAHRDPWEDEPMLTVYIPLIGAAGASGFAILLAFVLLK